MRLIALVLTTRAPLSANLACAATERGIPDTQITGITRDFDHLVQQPLSRDLWSVTWGSDDNIYMGWGPFSDKPNPETPESRLAWADSMKD